MIAGTYLDESSAKALALTTPEGCVRRRQNAHKLNSTSATAEAAALATAEGCVCRRQNAHKLNSTSATAEATALATAEGCVRQWQNDTNYIPAASAVRYSAEPANASDENENAASLS